MLHRVRNSSILCALLLGFALVAAFAGGGGAQSAGDSNSPPSGTEETAAKAAARRKKFEAIRRQLEAGDSDGDSADAPDSSPMRIIALTPYVSTNQSGRRTTESLRVGYELTQDFSEGFLEIVSVGSVTARYPLPALTHGRHSISVPRGIPLANDPYTFDCNLPRSHYSGVTQAVSALWDNRDPDSANTRFPTEEDSSIYDCHPAPAPDDRDDYPADDAAAFRGDEVAITSFNIPHKRNRMLLSTGRSPEIQILGVNFEEGDEVVCSKQFGSNPPIQARARLHDVRTVSTAGHAANEAIPVLRAGRFDVPEAIVAHGTFVRLVGKPK